MRARPAVRLRTYVSEYVGWWEHNAGPITRRETPGDLVPLIFNFGTRIHIAPPNRPSAVQTVGSFTAGVFDSSVLVRTEGASGGLQVNLTIAGARLIFGRPAGEFVNRIVPLDLLLGRSAELLTEQFAEADGWGERFALVERFIDRRIAAAMPPSAAVMHAAARLAATRGQVDIARLVEEAGCSHKHLVARFRSEFGLTPKALARVLRFGAAIDRMKQSRPALRLADLAVDCGYYDQAHFDRDFRAFAGVTPSEWRREAIS